MIRSIVIFKPFMLCSETSLSTRASTSRLRALTLVGEYFSADSKQRMRKSKLKQLNCIDSWPHFIQVSKSRLLVLLNCVSKGVASPLLRFTGVDPPDDCLFIGEEGINSGVG